MRQWSSKTVFILGFETIPYCSRTVPGASMNALHSVLFVGSVQNRMVNVTVHVIKIDLQCTLEQFYRTVVEWN